MTEAEVTYRESLVPSSSLNKTTWSLSLSSTFTSNKQTCKMKHNQSQNNWSFNFIQHFEREKSRTVPDMFSNFTSHENKNIALIFFDVNGSILLHMYPQRHWDTYRRGIRRRLVGWRNRKNHRRSRQRRGSSLEVKEIEQEKKNDRE